MTFSSALPLLFTPPFPLLSSPLLSPSSLLPSFPPPLSSPLFSPPFPSPSLTLSSPLPFPLPHLPSLLPFPSPLSSSLLSPSSLPSSTQFQCLWLWCVYQYSLHWSRHCSAQEHHILPGSVSHRQTGGDRVQSHSQIRGTPGNETNQICSCGDAIQYAIELKMLDINVIDTCGLHTIHSPYERERRRRGNHPETDHLNRIYAALASFTKCS